MEPDRPAPRDELLAAVLAERFADWRDVWREDFDAKRGAGDDQAGRRWVGDTDLDRYARRKVLASLPDVPGRENPARREKRRRTA